MSVEDNMETILVDSGDEDQAEEETENCGGMVACHALLQKREYSYVTYDEEDETDEDQAEEECFENNDGSLGDPVPFE
jgi:hypothetical protein